MLRTPIVDYVCHIRNISKWKTQKNGNAELFLYLLYTVFEFHLNAYSIFIGWSKLLQNASGSWTGHFNSLIASNLFEKSIELFRELCLKVLFRMIVFVIRESVFKT